ncbi:hypothetical protein [Actinoplanes philippinensis]|uniref:hypothetical protein n=1 Tax=Actinoplanes philippinensis TaxID=35752 RepID=UPI0015A5BCCA|nr:hypothetical protein [Actinoplanes philippinensis]
MPTLPGGAGRRPVGTRPGAASAPPWLPVPPGWAAHLASPSLPLTREAVSVRSRLRLSPDGPAEGG